MDSALFNLCGHGVEVVEKLSGSLLTSFHSGGNVRWVIQPANTEGLCETLNVLKAHSIPYDIVGNGTNLLIPDKGYDGAIISLKRIRHITVAENYIYATAGVMLSTLSLIARDNSLTGLEFAIGIPATLGGAIYMNAGAYGEEIGDKVSFIDVLTNNRVETVDYRNLNYGYRESDVAKRGLLVLGAKLNLDYGEFEEIQYTVRELTAKRKSSQPSLPSAGSVFKKVNGVGAGYYVDRLGYKGIKYGGAMVSFEHANFIVNVGGAKTDDYITLRKKIADDVYQNFGVLLSGEVRILGE